MIGPVPHTREVERLVTSFREKLRELGDAEGRSPHVVYRGFTRDYTDRLLDVPSEIEALRPAIVVAWGPDCARYHSPVVDPAIVFIVNADWVALNLVTRQKITGVSTWIPGLLHERLALLRELLPKARRLAIMWEPSDSGNVRAFNASASSAVGFGFQRGSLEVGGARDLEGAFRHAIERDADALCVLSSPMSFVYRAQITRLAATHRLPAVYDLGEFAEAGGLLAYGGNLGTAFRQAAFQVDRILRGARPSTVPVDRPMKPELIVNLGVARSLGLTIPASVLARATRRLD
jgi:putative ABC transport system substrate-binding protein